MQLCKKLTVCWKSDAFLDVGGLNCMQRPQRGSKSKCDTDTHYDERQFDNCKSLEWKHPKTDNHEVSEKRRFVLIQCTKRGKPMETTSSFWLRFFIASLSCCHGLCLDEIHVAGHQPHSVDWPGIPYKRAMFLNRFHLARLLVNITTPVTANSKNISRELSLSTMTMVQPVQIVKQRKPVCVARGAPLPGSNWDKLVLKCVVGSR